MITYYLKSLALNTISGGYMALEIQVLHWDIHGHGGQFSLISRMSTVYTIFLVKKHLHNRIISLRPEFGPNMAVNFVSFYDFSLGFWNSSDGVVMFFSFSVLLDMLKDGLERFKVQRSCIL
jgi:hypothetical protein